MRAITMFVLLFAALTAPAEARTCYRHDELAGALAGKFGETRIATGGIGDTRAMALYVNPETGTWTVLVVLPEQNIACIAASGDRWQRGDASEPAAKKRDF